MKTLTDLSATVTDADFREGAGHHHHVGQTHEVQTADGKKGVFQRQMRVGPEGMILSAGAASIVIPTAELWKLAEKHEPKLAIPELKPKA